jgi:hypothetical protein
MEIEDAFAGGMPIDEAVKTYALKEADKLTDVTQDTSSKNERVDALFSLDVGEVSSALALPDGDMAFVALDAVTPAAVKPIDKVKPQIIAAWRKEQAAGRALAKAAQLRVSDDPLAAARKQGLPVELHEDVSLSDKDYEPFFSVGVDKLIELPQRPNAIALGVVRTITPGSSAWTPKEASIKELQEAQTGDTNSQFYQLFSNAQNTARIKINERVLQALAQPDASSGEANAQ